MFQLRFPFETFSDLPVEDVTSWYVKGASRSLLLTKNSIMVSVFEKDGTKWIHLFQYEVKAKIRQWYQVKGTEQLLLRTDAGLYVYYLDLPRKTFVPLGKSTEIISDCEFGCFYDNPNDTGVVTIDLCGKIQFYKLMAKDGVSSMRWLKNSFYQALNELDDVRKIFVRELNCNQDYVMVHDQKVGICIFKFNDKYVLQKWAQISVKVDVMNDLVFLSGGTKSNRKFILVEEKNCSLYMFEGGAYKKYGNISLLEGLKTRICVGKSSDSVNADYVYATTARGVVCCRADTLVSILKTSNLPAPDRSAAIVAVVHEIMFLQINGKICTSELIPLETHDNNATKCNIQKYSFCSSKMLENHTKHTAPKPKVDKRPAIKLPLHESGSFLPKMLSLGDLITVKSFAECVNIKTGKLNFSLPLVQICNPLGIDIGQRLSYIQSEKVDQLSVLGAGWHMQLSYIFLLAESPFGDHQYVWNRNGLMVNLVRCGPHSNIARFEFVGMQDDMSIQHFIREGKWLVQGTGFSFVFGTGSKGSAFQKAVCHKHWMGPIAGNQNLEKKIVAWYLMEAHTNCYVQEFSYIIDEEQVGNELSTNAVLLSSVQDSLGNGIELSYQSKSREEYRNWEFDFPRNMTCTSYTKHFLCRMSVRSPQFKNNFSFDYVVQDGVRYLKQIRQADQKLVFGYISVPNSFCTLAKITVPDGSIYTFEYKKLNQTMCAIPSFQLEAEVQPKINDTSRYIVLSYIEYHGDQLIVDIYDRDLKKIVQKLRMSQEKPLTYQLRVEESIMVVQMVFESGIKSIHLLSIIDGVWRQTSNEITLVSQELCRYGKDFVVIYSSAGLKELYRWTNGSFSSYVIPESYQHGADFSILTSDDAFLLCSRENVCVARYDPHADRFNFRIILDDVPEARSMNALNALDCNDGERDALKQALLNSSIYIFENVLAIVGLELTQEGFGARICLYHLGDDLQVTERHSFFQHVTAFGESLRTSNGHIIEVKTVIDGGKIKICSENLASGTTVTAEELQRCNAKLLQLFDMKIKAGMFQLHAISGGFHCANMDYLYNGRGWNEGKGSVQSQNMPGNLVLTKNGNTIALNTLSSGVKVHSGDLGKNSALLLTRHFLAYQTDSEAKYVLLLHSDGKPLPYGSLPVGETIFANTDQFLITSKPSELISDSHKKILTFRDLALTHELAQCTVLHRSSLQVAARSVRNDYVYAEPEVAPVAGLIFRQTTKLPQLGEGYGQVKYSSVGKDEMQQFYNENGECVFTSKRSKASDAVTLKQAKNVIYDASGKLEIVECSPYRWEDQQVYFYGFEKHEVLPKHWTCEGKVISDEFAASGHNFCRLKHGNQITLRMQPKPSHVLYRFSCLLRSHSSALRVGCQTTDVTAFFGGIHLCGTVMRQLNDWYVVEVELSNEISTDARFVIKTCSILDVDHFWFAPTDFDFKANIFDHTDGNRMGEIHKSGNMTRHFYDICNKQALSTDFGGNLEKFILHSKHCDSNQLRLSIQVEPQQGFVETFNNYNLGERWIFESLQGWSVRPCRLIHGGSDEGSFSFRDADYFSGTLAIGLSYDLHTDSKLHISYKGQIVTLQRLSEEQSELHVFSEMQTINSNGALYVMFLENRVIVTIDGFVYFDQSTTVSMSPNALNFKVVGSVEIENLHLEVNPLIRVQFTDPTDCLVQELKIISGSEIDIQETIYDALYRPVFRTIWTRYMVPSSFSMVRYLDKFVDKSVADLLKHGKMRGLIDRLNESHEGYPYFSIVYENALTNKHLRVGLPGKEYRADGPFTEHLLNTSETPDILEILFPLREEYRKIVTREVTGVLNVDVFDNRDNKVAHYIKSVGTNHQLTTFAYNERNKLIARFPPVYHDKAKTALQKDTWTLDETDTLQQLWGLWSVYDENDKLIEERGPDKGTTKFYYSDYRLVRQETGSTTVNYTYDKRGELILKECGGQKLEIIVQRQAEDINKIGLTLKLVSSALEEYRSYDVSENLLEQSSRVDAIHPKRNTIRYGYEKTKMAQIYYPEGSNLHVIYSYDANGRLVGIGDHSDIYRFVRNSYNSNGKLLHQLCQSNCGQTFERQYKYNSAFYPTGCEDQFMSQSITYGRDSFGGLCYGGKKINAVEIEAKWVSLCDPGIVQINANSFVSGRTTKQQSELFFKIMQEKGIIDAEGFVVKSFYPEFYIDIPMVMTDDFLVREKINQVFARKSGYRCDYGNHGELLRAKYYVADERVESGALTVNSFAGIDELKKEQREDLWRKLVQLQVLLEDNIHGDIATTHGKKGECILSEDIKCMLDNDVDFAIYFRRIENLILHSIVYHLEVTRDVFMDYFIKWNEPIHSDTYMNKLQTIGQQIWTFLTRQNFIGPTSESCLLALAPKFCKVLAHYRKHFRSIIRIMFEGFARSLGTNPGDVESYRIDLNGNHGCFRSGTRWFDIKYDGRSNRIESVLIYDPIEKGPYRIDHDARGNVIEARHKGIVKIEYDNLVNRANKYILQNGTNVSINYNCQGERVLKRVLHQNGAITERVYSPGFNGCCLADYLVHYSSIGELQDEVSTFYIYDDSQLVGFKRDDQYYNVLTDHEGSVRLILLDGQVVAAYDYMPYGQPMRCFEADSRSGIIFRFTGQEYDEELGLYNYHARSYDPELGRFFQVDPLEQYASPYKYAGNSPLDMIDPDGRFAFLLIPFAIAGGAYLGGLIYNSNSNPFDWDWKDKGTYFSMLGGALVGGGTAGILGFAGACCLLGGYLGGASSEDNWFPRQWKWDKTTFFGIFAGGLTGTLLPGTWTSFVALTAATQSTMAFTVVAGFVYAGGNYAVNAIKYQSPNPLDWDWSKPGIYFRLFAGLTMSINVASSAYSCVQLVGQMQNIIKFFGVVEIVPDVFITKLDISAQALRHNRAIIEKAFPHAIKSICLIIGFCK